MDVVTEGVYFLYDGDELVFIGTSNNLFWRIGEHVKEGAKKFDRFELYPTKDRLRLEGFLIRMFHPKYNVSDGAYWDKRKKDAFPNSTIEEAIKKYDEYMGDPYIRELEDETGWDVQALLGGLLRANAPMYKIGDDYWRLDKSWLEQHREDISRYVCEYLDSRDKRRYAPTV